MIRTVVAGHRRCIRHPRLGRRRRTYRARVKTKMRSDYYAGLELPIYRADAIALAQLLAGSATFVNEVPEKLEAVTSADLQRVASTYLTVANRTVVDRKGINQGPVFSPDGRHIAFISTGGHTDIMSSRSLTVVAAAGGAPRVFGLDDAWINEFVWSRDSRSIPNR